MVDSDDRDDLEGGRQDRPGPESTGGTGGESHGEDLGMHLDHHAEGDAEERREPGSSGAENGGDDPVPFDKESRLSDVDHGEESPA
jgi:hypothetical protein